MAMVGHLPANTKYFQSVFEGHMIIVCNIKMTGQQNIIKH